MDALIRFIRTLPFLIILGLPIAARAQSVCIVSDPSWTTPYSQGSIQWIAYMINSGKMAVQFRDNTLQAFEGVPQGVAQQVSQMQNPTTFYTQNIAPNYHQALLTEFQPSGYCPILNEDGSTWLLTH